MMANTRTVSVYLLRKGITNPGDALTIELTALEEYRVSAISNDAVLYVSRSPSKAPRGQPSSMAQRIDR